MGYLWPGLNIHVDESKPRLNQRTEEEQIAWEEKRKDADQRRFRPKDSSARGWSGGQWGGQKVIAEDPDEVTSQFSAYLLEAKRVSHMNNKVGRVYSFRAMVAVGNGRGTFGIDMVAGPDIHTASRQARAKALKKLQYIERYEDRTVYEDMYVNHHCTYMNIRQQPKGYGLRCHRAIMTLCRLIGIKDLYVKTTGGTMMLTLVKCFVKGLHSQETHQQKADRLGYHVVECDPLRDFYPVVLASPSTTVRTEPYDEYKAFLNKPLIAKQIRSMEGNYPKSWSKILYSSSQGPVVPRKIEIPDVMRQIKRESL